MSVKLDVAQRNDIKTNEYWTKYLLGMITLETQNFVFSTLGNQVTIPDNSGTTTISFRRYNHLPIARDTDGTVKKIAEGIAPEPLKIEAQKVQGTINQYGAYIKETDWTKKIHMDDIKNIYMPELARHAAEVRERVIMENFADASEWYVGNADDADDLEPTDVLTLKEVRKVVLSMKNYRRKGHTKFGGKPVLVVHINVMQDLLDDADLKDRILTPGNDNTPIKTGTLEKYLMYGFYVIETLIAEVEKNEATTPINVYTSYLLGKDPYAVISLGSSNIEWQHVPFKASHSQPLAQWASFGYKMWVGAKITDPLAITKIYSASAYDIDVDFSNDNLGRAASQEEEEEE